MQADALVCRQGPVFVSPATFKDERHHHFPAYLRPAPAPCNILVFRATKKYELFKIFLANV
jgi:hypothetical protein